MRRSGERGSANLVGIMIAALALVIFAGLGLRAFQGASAATQSQIKVMRAQFGMNEFWGMAQADATGSESVFIPSHDVFSQANGYSFGDGHPLPADTSNSIVAAPSSTGHEIDFYSKDAFHHPHFWAYVFSNGTLAKYSYSYRDSNGMAIGVRSSPTWTMPATSFKTYYEYASQFSSVDAFVRNALSSAGVSLHDILTAAPYPEVYLSNRLTVYDLVTIPNNAHGSQHVELAAGVGGGSLSITVPFTPRPASGLSVTPSALTLGYQGANGLPATGAFGATINDYHRDLTLTSCGVATLSRTGKQVSVPGESATYGVSPTAVGNCSVTVATLDGAQPSAPVQIAVQGQLVVSPAVLTFLSPSAPSQQATLSEPGYMGAFSESSNTCNGYAQLSGGGNGPGPTVVAVQPEATTRALNGESCIITFSDAYGSQGALTIVVDPNIATPSPSPTPSACNQGSPCLFLRYAVGDGATYENADCQVGVNQDCHGSYVYTVVDSSGHSVDVSALANDAIAWSDSSGNLYSPSAGPPAAGSVPNESACQSLLQQAATDQGHNGNDNGQGTGTPFWFQFLLNGSSSYSIGQSLNGFITQDASGWGDGTNQISVATC